ncbi:hypothetical protein BHM03_00034201 [Ensete ventricosum]|nr:hypothetical protein BHM03_00034201 [Ensete ventricosum]
MITFIDCYQHRGVYVPSDCPCALAHPRSSRDGIEARPDGWIPRILPWRSTAGVVEFGSGGGALARVNSDANPGDLAERVNLGTNSGDLAERVLWYYRSAQLVALPYRLFRRVPRGRDYPESGLVHGVLSPLQELRHLLPHRPIWRFRLDWSAHPIGNASPYLSKEETVLVRRLKGILSSSHAIKEMTELWLVEADRMDLGELRGMPKVASGKVPLTRPAAREVGASPAREAPKASSKRPIDAPAEDAARCHKKVKVLTRRHKSRLSEGESRSRSKGKEPATPSEEPETPTESEEGGASLAHHRPRSMKDLFKTKVHKDDVGYYMLLMSDLGH